MINLFDTGNDDFQYMLDNMGKTIYIDDVLEKALIKHIAVNNDYDDIELTTLTPIQRGDLITYENNKYLILSQVNSTRYGRYKALMRKCNFILHVHVADEEVVIGHEDSGKPIVETQPTYEDYAAIVTSKVTEWATGGQLNLPQGQIQITIKDTGSTKLTVGDDFTFEGLPWTINWIDRTENGLLILSCEN